jgi:tripartite-type tricarboxylate transporter receptor subunit TctC
VVAARLNAEIKKILAMPDISKKITDLGGDVRTDTPEQFGGWIAKAIADWGAVVKAEGISTDG